MGNATIRTAPWSFRRETCWCKVVCPQSTCIGNGYLFFSCFADSLQIVVAHPAFLIMMYYHISGISAMTIISREESTIEGRGIVQMIPFE